MRKKVTAIVLLLRFNPEIMVRGGETVIRAINEYAASGQPFLFIIDFSAQQGIVRSVDSATEDGILFDIRGINNFRPENPRKPEFFRFTPVDFDIYRKAFIKVAHHLKRGDTYLLNLTFPTPVETNLDLQAIFHSAEAPFRLLVPERFVVFSPEPFVTIRDGFIYSCPMKGTISADIPGAAQKLLGSRKERFEHNTIVDLIRNDLSVMATGTKVTRFRYLEYIQTNRGGLLQMSSEIRARLPENYRENMGNILFSMLPAGSVTGAPKERTVSIIRETENYNRGYYTGIFGYSDGRNLLSAVSIRFIEHTNEGLIFKSGGGITALSRCEEEYRELMQKIYLPVKGSASAEYLQR